MSQAPVFQSIAWGTVLVQLGAGAVLVWLAGLVPGIDWPEALYLGVGFYLAYSFGSRAVLAREHKAGMRQVKRGDFGAAIPFFERSFDFFERHAWLDRWRAITLMSSSRISYREMALVNVAFCYSKTGEGERAEAYYRRALDAFPDSVIARTALRLVESVRGGSVPGAV